MAAHKSTASKQTAPQAAKPGSDTVAPGPAAAAPQPEYDFPAAGPHARPHLTDPERTPGTGALPDPGSSRDSDATG